MLGTNSSTHDFVVRALTMLAHGRHFRFATLSALLAVAYALVAPAAQADSIVNFWLSTTDAGPNVPVVYVAPGAVGQLQLWARPATGYRMSAFSLDLVTAQPGVVSFQSFDVLNPQVTAMPLRYRHQIVFDSATGLDVTPNEIYGFLGYTFFEDAIGLTNGAGIGPECGSCSTTSGTPAWHVANVTFQAGLVPGEVELFLSIGEQGVWQSPGDAVNPDDPTNTSVVFGLPNDAINQWAVLGEGVDHRHEPQGVADAIIRIASADFNQDGNVDGADFLTWQRGFGVGATLAQGDADGSGTVDAADLAVWRAQFGSKTAILPVGLPAPEPTGLAASASALVFIAAYGRRRRLSSPRLRRSVASRTTMST
jgi:hypothetical protein